METGRHLGRVRVGREPVAAALTPDERLLVVANHLPAGRSDLRFVATEVTIIDTETLTVRTNISLANGGVLARAIDEYLKGLEPVPSPLLVNAELSVSAERGRKLFEDPVAGCAQCHPSPLFTDQKSHDVGTANRSLILDRPTVGQPAQRRAVRHHPRTRDRRAPRPTTAVQAPTRITCNARMGTRELKAHCALDESTLVLLQSAMAEYNLSARAYDRILKVSRTIADLECSDRITTDHVGEAVGFRALDRQLWR